MAILAFQKPDKVIMLEGTETVGRFEFRPLEPGYGQTIGNALRRIPAASSSPLWKVSPSRRSRSAGSRKSSRPSPA